MAAELVAHVPHRERRLIGVPGRQSRHQPAGRAAVDWAAGAVVLPGPMREADAVSEHRQHLRVRV